MNKLSKFTISSTALWNNQQAFFRYLEKTERGYLIHKIEPLLTKINPAQDTRLTLQHEIQDIITIQNFITEPHLGIKVIHEVQPSSSQFLNLLFSVKNHTSIGETSIPLPLFLNLYMRYFGMISEIVSYKIWHRDGKITISMFPNLPDITCISQIEGIVYALLRTINYYYQLNPVEIKFLHSKPVNDDNTCIEYMNVEPLYGTAELSLSYEFWDYELSLNSQLLTLVNQLHNKYYKSGFNESMGQQVTHIVEYIMPFNEPTKKQVCHILNMSVSTLERKLKKEGLVFKQVLILSKMKLAKIYLKKENRSASETAFLLGYQSPSQFFKAFKTWFGLTPNEFKNRPG